jgi:hypothetical protein
MGCVYHPHLDTVKFCEQCEADLCDNCAIRVEDGRTLCHRCIVALSAEDVETEESNRKLSAEARRLGLAKKWRPTYIQVVVTIWVVLLIMLLGLHLHWSQIERQPLMLLNPAKPIEVLASLQLALLRYAVTHGERYPDNLYDLLPDILPDKGRNRGVLRSVYYRLDDSEGYRLQIKAGAPMSGQNLVATANGIRPIGERE